MLNKLYVRVSMEKDILKLLRLAKEILSIEFNTEEEMKNYQDEHEVRRDTELKVTEPNIKKPGLEVRNKLKEHFKKEPLKPESVLTKGFTSRLNLILDKGRDLNKNNVTIKDRIKKIDATMRLKEEVIDNLIDKNVSFVMKHSDGEEFYLLSKGFKKDSWRVTRLDYYVNDKLTPSSHSDSLSYEEALKDIIGKTFYGDYKILEHNEAINIPPVKQK